MKIQSISDIITNSSSEVFICSCNNPKKLAKEVQEFINTLMEMLGYPKDDYYYSGATVTVAKSDGEINGWGYPYNKGNLLIESNGENSIPWNVIQILEELEYFPVFKGKITNVKRYHLG